MPEEQTTTPSVDPHAGGTGDPQPVAATQTTTDPHAGDSPTETPLSLEEGRKIRSESTNLRQRLKDAEKLAAELKAFKEQTEAEKLSDTEKQTLAQQKLEKQLAEYQSQNSELLTKLQQRTINSEVRVQALQMGIDPKAAVKLIELSEVVTDDEGTPTNVPELLKKLTKEYPTLVGKPHAPASGGATNPSRSQTSGAQTITKEYVQEVQRGGQEAWKALSEQERQRISTFIKQGGLFKK